MKRKGILACCILLLMLLLSAVPSVQAEENKRVIRGISSAAWSYGKK